MVAAFVGSLPILQTLIGFDRGAIDAVDPWDGGTAFHKACDLDHADCAAELVQHGCDTELMDHDNETGWDLAERRGHGALIRRCKLAQKLALRKAQKHDSSTIKSSAPATDADASTAPQVDDPEKQVKAAKKAVTNRKKKERKKAKKAAAAQQQLLLSQAAAETEAETETDLHAATGLIGHEPG
jgi:ankyrin repeat protein